MNVEKDGLKFYKEFINERLQENSVVDIFALLTKVKSLTFKTCATAIRVKVNDKVQELSEAVDLFAKCSIVSSTRDIDMPNIVGEYELSSIARSFMKADGEFNHGGEDKSELVHSICSHVGSSAFVDIEKFLINVSVIDAMQVLPKLKKPDHIRTFNELAKVFLDRILDISSGSRTIIVAFDEYRQNSLKGDTRKIRKGKKIPVQYEVNDKTIIDGITMAELLSHELTKKYLSIYFQKYLNTYFFNQSQFSYILAGNGETTGSFIDNVVKNNHEEADTLMVHCLTYINPGETVLIHSNDTDVFVLFVSLLKKLTCDKAIMKWTEDTYIDLTKINNELENRSEALLDLHALTGNDIVERFSGKK